MEYIIIVLLLFIIAIAIIKSGKKDYKIEINKLIQYLGGMENIVNYEINMSRFTVTLKDIDIVNKEGIQKLGAKGIVQINNQLKIVLGSNTTKLKKYIDNLK